MESPHERVWRHTWRPFVGYWWDIALFVIASVFAMGFLCVAPALTTFALDRASPETRVYFYATIKYGNTHWLSLRRDCLSVAVHVGIGFVIAAVYAAFCEDEIRSFGWAMLFYLGATLAALALLFLLYMGPLLALQALRPRLPDAVATYLGGCASDDEQYCSPRDWLAIPAFHLYASFLLVVYKMARADGLF